MRQLGIVVEKMKLHRKRNKFLGSFYKSNYSLNKVQFHQMLIFKSL